MQLPLAPLAETVRTVTGQIDASTRDLAAAIRAENRKSAVALAAIIAGTLAAALLVAWVAARRASRPLVEMAGVASEVGRGNLDRLAVERSGGEIGDLEKALNDMIRGLRQRDLLRQTFGRYVAPGVVDQVLSRGNASLGGVKRKVTIFFSDLKGFTTLSERTDPEALVQLLNEYFDAMTRVILQSEGTLDKYIGDAILAFWGDPVPHADDAARACRAALDQTRRLKALWPAWDARGLPRLDMRIGIETGEAIVGNVGSELKLNYTVLGDVVNFASRLESVNKLYGTRILIGEATRREAADAIEVRELDLLTVAGKTRPVRVYELLGMAGEVGAESGAGFKAYERALCAWRGRRWDEAEAEAARAEALLGADEPTRALRERIVTCKLQPPPGGWDGSITLDHK